MDKRILLLGGLMSVLLSTIPALGQGSPDPESPRYKGLVALSQFMRTSSEADLDMFIRELVGAELQSQHSEADLRRLLAGLRDEFRGIEVRGGSPSGPYSAAVSFAAPGKQGRSSVSFEVEPEPPHRFVSIDFGSPTSDSSVKSEFGSGQQAELIESISRALIDGYIYEERGREMAQMLVRNMEAARYRSLQSPVELAERLTLDLQEVSNDLHLRIRFGGGQWPGGYPDTAPSAGWKHSRSPGWSGPSEWE